MKRNPLLRRRMLGTVLVALVSLAFDGFALTAAAQPGLMLWNKLGSAWEITHSLMGPDGAPFEAGGPLAFQTGRFGSGFTPAGRVSGVDFGSWDAVNPDYDQRGTLEFWWKPARRYDEGNSPPDETFVSGVYVLPLPRPMQILYRWRDEGTGVGGFDFQVGDETGVEHSLHTGKVAPFRAGEWVHAAFVWDMNGLPNHPDVFYGAYVDGRYYPLQDAHNPGASINFLMGRREPSYLSLGYYTADFNDRTLGVMDNIKIWNYAKEDFADRFVEGPPPDCAIAMTQDSYTQGQTVTAASLRIRNPDGAPHAVEMKLWVTAPFQPFGTLNQGAGGELVLPAGFDENFGPAPFLSVDVSVPLGFYEFGCRLLDPATGEVFGETQAPFLVK